MGSVLFRISEVEGADNVSEEEFDIFNRTHDQFHDHDVTVHVTDWRICFVRNDVPDAIGGKILSFVTENLELGFHREKVTALRQ